MFVSAWDMVWSWLGCGEVYTSPGFDFDSIYGTSEVVIMIFVVTSLHRYLSQVCSSTTAGFKTFSHSLQTDPYVNEPGWASG